MGSCFSTEKDNKPALKLQEKEKNSKKEQGQTIQANSFMDLEVMLESLKGKTVDQLKLNLTKQKLDDQSVYRILVSLKLCKNLQMVDLDVSDNQILADGLQMLLEGFKQHKATLWSFKLNVANNKISDQGCKYLNDFLVEMDNLKVYELNISKNQIMNEGLIAHLKDAIKVLKLEQYSLKCQECDIGSAGFINFFNQISYILTVHEMDVDFSNNKIDKVGVDCLSEPFLNLQELKKLNLNIAKNAFQDLSLLSLSNALSKLKVLQILNVNVENNQNISQDEEQSFKQKVQEMPVLIEGSVKLTGQDIFSFKKEQKKEEHNKK